MAESPAGVAPAPAPPGASLHGTRGCHVLRHFSFFRLHLLYFIVLSLVGGAVIWAFEGGSLQYSDTLFQAVSAACVTGLSALDMGAVTTGTQITMLVLIVMGGGILLSAVPPALRRHYFERAIARLAAEAEDQAGAGQRPALLHERITEYRALGIVVCMVLAYCATVQVVGFLALGLYLSQDASAHAIVQSQGVAPWWFAAFVAVSAFNNAGFVLFSASLIPFVTDRFVLLVLSTEILLGNVAAPLAFRAIVAALHCARPHDEAYKFLLKHPRRCFTHMFRGSPTWQLACWVIAFTGIEFVLFLALDFNEPFLATFTGPDRTLMGYFQSVSTRTAGFNVMNVFDVAPAMQVVFCFMMYLSSYPVFLSIRCSEVQQVSDGNPTEVTAEGALPSRVGTAIDADASASMSSARQPGPLARLRTDSEESTLEVAAHEPVAHSQAFEWSLTDAAYVSSGIVEAVQRGSSNGPSGAPRIQPVPAQVLLQIKDIFSRELPFLLLCLLLVCIADGYRLQSAASPPWLSIWGVMFELSSAFGTVGLTLSPNAECLSMSLSPFSRVVIMAVMLAGRHRGLPRSVDTAVYLPALFNHPVPPAGELLQAADSATVMLGHASTFIREQVSMIGASVGRTLGRVFASSDTLRRPLDAKLDVAAPVPGHSATIGSSHRPSHALADIFQQQQQQQQHSGTTGALGAAAAAAAALAEAGDEEGETLGAIRNAAANVGTAGPQYVLLQQATVMKGIRAGAVGVIKPLDAATDEAATGPGRAIGDADVLSSSSQVMRDLLDNFGESGNLVSTAGADSSTRQLRHLAGELVEDREVAFEEGVVGGAGAF